MKKSIALALCITLMLAVGGCGKSKKSSDPQGTSISDIPTAEADKNKNDSEENKEAEGSSQSDDSADSNNSDNNSKGTDKGSSQNSRSQSVDTSDRTAASDKTEIQNNIRDAQELIDEGLYDDAKAIIKVLRSRKLSSDEEKKVDELERKMLKVSD